MSTELEQIGSGMPDGEYLGVSGGKIAFFGATPIVQQTGGLSAADATTVPGTSGAFTSTQAAAILNLAIACQKMGLTT